MYEFLFNCKSFDDNILTDYQTLFDKKSQGAQKDVNNIFIGKRIYGKDIALEEVNIIVRLLQTEWISIQSIALYDCVIPYDEMLYSRKIINTAFALTKESLKYCDLESRREIYIGNTVRSLEILSTTIVDVENLQEDFLLKISSLNSVESPVYQYLHTLLEIEYHIITLNYMCNVNETKLDGIIQNALRNLVLISRAFYNRSASHDHLFTCKCIKKLWLVIQLFCEKIRPENFFWNIFNTVMDREEPYFTLWLLKDVANLQAYSPCFEEEVYPCDRMRSNYDLFMNKLKMFLTDAEPNTLKKLFRVIEPLLCDLWIKQAKIEVYQHLWDYYSKRLNVSDKNYATLTAREMYSVLQKITTRLDCDEHFEMFVKLLITHLKQHPQHWGKMKGRIYSQLGPNKVKDLTDIGVAHVMLLFMALADINHEELIKKILAFMESLSKDKYSSVTWHLYTTLIFKEVKDGKSLEKIAHPLIQMLNDASCENKNFRLIKDFIVNFEHIIKISANLQCHQWLFFDFWLGKYMSVCYINDLNYTLEVLSTTLDRACHVDNWVFWEPAFRDHVYPALKILSTQSNPSGVLGSIAGELCVLMPQMSNEIFTVFTSETIAPKISAQFLNIVLKNYPASFMLSQHQESLVVQTWTKVCFLAVDHTEDLTRNVLKLDCFPGMLKTHIADSDNPIFAFIEYLGSDVKHHLQSSVINKLLELSFGQADKWISHYLAHPDQEAFVHRIYTYISLAFMHCGPLLYSRSKSSSALTRLLQTLLLSTDFLIGKHPHPFMLSAVKKTWHLFFEALVKLNTDSDMFLERSLRDMITKYMQYFSTSDSPIIKCIQNETTAPVALDKICNSYMRHPVKEPDANILKILKILADIAESTTSEILMRLIVTKTLYGLFEVVIFHAQRNTAINVIRIITVSQTYSQVRTEFNDVIVAITEKHMAFNTINYFQLMYILAKFIPNDVKNLLPRVKQQVVNVERLRGVGFDKNLRVQFEKLENVLKEN